MGKTYVMSDIHGELNKLRKVITAIDFTLQDKLYILGEVVDRGKHPIEIIEWIMRTPNVELIRGNHESMFLDYLNAENEQEEELALQFWLPNGGLSTLHEFAERPKHQQEKIQKFIESLPFYKVIGNIVLVHSGLDIKLMDKSLPVSEGLKKQAQDVFLWSREEFFGFKGLEDSLIIFGHTPTNSIERI